MSFLASRDRAERYGFGSRYFLLHSYFLFPPFLGGNIKGEKNNQSLGQKTCLSTWSVPSSPGYLPRYLSGQPGMLLYVTYLRKIHPQFLEVVLQYPGIFQRLPTFQILENEKYQLWHQITLLSLFIFLSEKEKEKGK